MQCDPRASRQMVLVDADKQVGANGLYPTIALTF